MDEGKRVAHVADPEGLTELDLYELPSGALRLEIGDGHTHSEDLVVQPSARAALARLIAGGARIGDQRDAKPAGPAADAPWYVMHNHGETVRHSHSTRTEHPRDWPSPDHEGVEITTWEENLARYAAAPPVTS